MFGSNPQIFIIFELFNIFVWYFNTRSIYHEVFIIFCLFNFFQILLLGYELQKNNCLILVGT